MCVLYVSFWPKLRLIQFRCVAMGISVLFIFGSRLLLYSAGSRIYRVPIVLSGFTVRLLCFIPGKNCVY